MDRFRRGNRFKTTLPKEMRRFSTKIFARIASSLQSSADLANLCLVSRSYLGVARSSLYRHLYLKDNLPHIEDTLALLKRNAELRNCVVSLALATRQLDSIKLWFDPSEFQGLENIRKLKIINLPSSASSEVQRFFAEFYRMSKELEEISCTGLGDLSLKFESLANIPAKLRKISFTMRHPLDKSIMFATTLYNPENAISHLQIRFHLPDRLMEYFGGLRFKHLDTLKIIANSAPTVDPAPLNTFLEAHPLIHTLSVSDFHCVKNNSTGPKILPNLRALSASAPFITSLAAICDRTRKVTSLHLIFKRPKSDFKDIISATGSLFKLTHFSYLFPISCLDAESDLHERLRDSINLKWWSIGTLIGVGEERTSLFDALSKFPKLSRIDFDIRCKITEEEVQNLAEKVKSLCKICFFDMGESTPEVLAEFEIIRKLVQGELTETSIAVVVERRYSFANVRIHSKLLKERRMISWHSVNWKEDIFPDKWDLIE